MARVAVRAEAGVSAEGMRLWGESMSRHGWPMGVALVWSIKSLELVCSVLRLGRRLVVPACLGHLSYLVPAMWIEHKMRWFVVGPGGVGMDNGIEFTVVLVVCSVACILGFWPLPPHARYQRPCHRTGSQNRRRLAMSAMPAVPTPICAAVAGVITSKGHTNAAVFCPGVVAVCWDRSTE